MVRQARGIAIRDRRRDCVLGLSISFVLEQLVRSQRVGRTVGASFLAMAADSRKRP